MLEILSLCRYSNFYAVDLDGHLCGLMRMLISSRKMVYFMSGGSSGGFVDYWTIIVVGGQTPCSGLP